MPIWTFAAFYPLCDGRKARRTAAAAALCLLAACGGGGSDGMEAAVATGNAGQIRKEYQEALARVNQPPAAGAAATSGSGAASNTVVSATGSAPASRADSTEDAAAADTGLVMPAADAVPLADDPVAVSFRAAALAAVNEARSVARQCGEREMPAVGPLHWDAHVAWAALLETEWMRSRNTFGHAWENGELVWDRLSMAGYLWQVADENIAAGFNSLAAAMQAWLDSPPHCVALMRGDIEDIGIAVMPGQAGSRYSAYWTMALATRKRVD